MTQDETEQIPAPHVEAAGVRSGVIVPRTWARRLIYLAGSLGLLLLAVLLIRMKVYW